MATYGFRHRHDLVITDPSTSDIVGLVCKRINGVPMYSELDGKSLADFVTSTAPTQTSTNPEEELLLGQSTHHAGFGQEYYDSGDPKRYYESYGCDLSYEGQAMAGWSSSNIQVTSAVATAPTIVNADMELETSGWTNAERSSTQHYEGLYSYKVPFGGAGDGYQVLTPSIPGAAVTFTGWTFGGAASEPAKIGIDDGVTTTWSTTNTTQVWVEKSVAKTLSTASTQLKLLLYKAGGDTYYDDVSLTITTPVTMTGSVLKGVEFNSKMYVAIGNYLVKLNTTGNGWLFVGNLGAAITDLQPYQVAGTDYLFIALGASTCRYMTTAEVIYISTLAELDFTKFAWVNTTVDTMYGSDGNNTIRNTINPLNGGTQWSVQTIVGDAATPTTHMQEKGGALLIDKEDMPYYLSAAGATQKDLAPECKSGEATHSGKNSTIWQGEYFRPTGDQALLRSGTTNSWIQPAKYITNSTAFSGQVDAVVGDEEWLYTAVRNGEPNLLVNGNFDVGTSCTDWTLEGAGAAVAQSSTQAKIGTYSARLTRGGTDCILYQNVSYTAYIGKKITVGCWVYATVASRARIRVYDGVTATAFSSFHSGVAGWEWLTASLTIGAAATVMRHICEVITGNTLAYFDGAIMVEGSSIAEPPDPDYYPHPATIFKGREETVDGTSAWRWHPVHQPNIPTVSAMWISNVYQKRLWIASASDNLYYLPLPTKYADITNDVNASFKTGTYFITPWLHRGFEKDTKGLISLTAALGHTYDADIYWECHYQKLGDTTWTDMGDLKGSSGVRTATIYRTASTTSPMYRYKFVAITDDTTKTPILLDYTAKTLLYPSAKSILLTKVQVGREVIDKSGGMSNKNEVTKQNTLLANMRAATWLISLTEYITDRTSGNTIKVRLLPLPQSEAWRVPVETEVNKDAVSEYTLLMLKVATS